MPISQIVTNSIANEAVVTADLANSAVTTVKIADGAMTRAKMGYSGAVLQVIQAAKTDTQSTSSTSYVDVTGLSVSITPTSASSKFLILFDVKLGANINEYAYTRLLRDATSIYSNSTYDNTSTNYVTSGDAEGRYSTYQNGGIFLDSPATTSSVTYKVQFRCARGNPVYINRTENFNSEARGGASSITVMEIAA
jgi:hypothetical protein